ncbi:MAG TPA: ABC transporter ATP-binding protein [Candidatus Polarisedimenticolia bacterium]|nr:ABC transporter ATP-binding protein [Candidatus Polarisedimenticolia bacterium]
MTAERSAVHDPVVVVRDLRKTYGDTKAVDGIEFEVGRGEVFGLLGPNGAGKTTTVEILEGLRRADSGTATVLGIDCNRDADALKPRIGVSLQTAALYPKLTVTEVLELFKSFYGNRPGRSADELIERFDVGEKRKTRTKELSGGQRQRLAVALALINDPEVVFLDEPTTGLDPAARRSLWDIVNELRSEDRTVLLTTHYMEEAEILCDRLAIMDHGRILETGTVKELVGRHFQERSVRFDAIAGLDDAQLGAIGGVASIAHEDGEVVLYTRDVPQTIGAVLDAAEAIGAEPENLLVRRPTLEDVFLVLTGRALRD